MQAEPFNINLFFLITIQQKSNFQSRHKYLATNCQKNKINNKTGVPQKVTF